MIKRGGTHRLEVEPEATGSALAIARSRSIVSPFDLLDIDEVAKWNGVAAEEALVEPSRREASARLVSANLPETKRSFKRTN